MPERLEIDDLTITASNGTTLVDRLSLEVAAGEIHGLIGESGSGKSLTAAAAVGLLPEGVAVTGGDIRFQGQSVLAMGTRQLRRLRGGDIGFVFQDPGTSLNPTRRVGDQVTESAEIHGRTSRRQRRAMAVGLLADVGIPSAAERSRSYPHHLSGGMRQRAMIATALSADPSLVIADEPTTALDVTIQAQVLDLLSSLRRDKGIGVLLITHDLGVAARLCDRITVVYSGRVLESGPVESVFRSRRSPYTQLLLDSVPVFEEGWAPPEDAADWVQSARHGCRFATRCPLARPACEADEPGLVGHGPGHRARCFATEPGGWA